MAITNTATVPWCRMRLVGCVWHRIHRMTKRLGPAWQPWGTSQNWAAFPLASPLFIDLAGAENASTFMSLLRHNHDYLATPLNCFRCLPGMCMHATTHRYSGVSRGELRLYKVITMADLVSSVLAIPDLQYLRCPHRGFPRPVQGCTP